MEVGIGFEPIFHAVGLADTLRMHCRPKLWEAKHARARENEVDFPSHSEKALVTRTLFPESKKSMPSRGLAITPKALRAFHGIAPEPAKGLGKSSRRISRYKPIAYPNSENPCSAQTPGSACTTEAIRFAYTSGSDSNTPEETLPVVLFQKCRRTGSHHPCGSTPSRTWLAPGRFGICR